MTDCAGYSIKCPDGKFRHYPYHNEGDAEFDAKHYTKGGKPCPDPNNGQPSNCPGGLHVVEPVVFGH